MREHPIPQDITGYRFHIIGSMTLKQFAELAVGVIVALIIYSTNLPTVIKWGLIFLSSGLGAGAAFLPIAERPLDHWLATFVKVLYQPTKFFWKREAKIPLVFSYQPNQAQTTSLTEIDFSPARRQRIKDYLASVKPLTHHSPQDLQTQTRIDNILDTFSEVTPLKIKITKQTQKPTLKTRIRSMQPEESHKRDTLAAAQPTSAATSRVQIPPSSPTQIKNQSAETAAPTIAAPTQTAVEVQNQPPPAPTRQKEDVVFNATLPFPTPPTQPNKLVGMVLTNNNELVPNAIVEIKNEQGQVVRAVTTNALGQFYITTPLKNGHYTINIDHDQYQFKSVEVALENEIIAPIEIRALS